MVVSRALTVEEAVDLVVVGPTTIVAIEAGIMAEAGTKIRVSITTITATTTTITTITTIRIIPIKGIMPGIITTQDTMIMDRKVIKISQLIKDTRVKIITRITIRAIIRPPIKIIIRIIIKDTTRTTIKDLIKDTIRAIRDSRIKVSITITVLEVLIREAVTIGDEMKVITDKAASISL